MDPSSPGQKLRYRSGQSAVSCNSQSWPPKPCTATFRVLRSGKWWMSSMLKRVQIQTIENQYSITLLIFQRQKKTHAPLLMETKRHGFQIHYTSCAWDHCMTSGIWWDLPSHETSAKLSWKLNRTWLMWNAQIRPVPSLPWSLTKFTWYMQ